MIFHKTLISWYLHHKRDLPWRDTTNPYLIWLSEIILQQTRVAQGISYYYAFTEAFPSIFDLAKASEQDVLKLWQGLGYYSRARNLHFTAQYIVTNFNGVFPTKYSELIKLKGVGKYTAAAIASFAFNEAVPVVDGNVFRVLSRYLNVDSDILLEKSKNEFTELAAALMPNDNPAMFNQAIMEFGALQCVPKNPNCNNCVFNQRCAALQYKTVHILPIKSRKARPKTRYFNFLYIVDVDQKIVIQQRTTKDIWQNMYQFPLIETTEIADIEHITSEIATTYFKKTEITSINDCPENDIIHKLTHQHLNVKFWAVYVNIKTTNSLILKDLNNLPLPLPIHNFLLNKK
jgi:A/G-specific adenine glycosylase